MKFEQEPRPKIPEIDAESAEPREYFGELRQALAEEKEKLSRMKADDPRRPEQETLIAELEEQIGLYEELTG